MMKMTVAQPSSILSDLFAKPYAYDFFQAVRLLERDTQITHSDLQNINFRGNSQSVRFKTWLSLAMPASAIYSLEHNQSKEYASAPIMTVTFAGLTGTNGALPLRYTEMLFEQRFLYRDHTAQDFFDLFNHRLLTLLYQAWRKHHIVVAYERREQDRFQKQVLSLVGLGTPALQKRMQHIGISDQLFAFYAGRFAKRQGSAEDLCAILSEQFSVPVTLQSFMGVWLNLTSSQRSRLGHSHCTLGTYPILGERVWDCQNKFRLRIGPLNFQRFQNFLPHGKAYQALVGMVRFCIGHSLAFDVQLILSKMQVSSCVLSVGSQTAYIGWTSWLTPGVNDDIDDVVLPGKS